jgi:hypothetical protein
VEIVSGIDPGGYLSTVVNDVTSNSTVSSGGLIVLSYEGVAVSATASACPCRVNQRRDTTSQQPGCGRLITSNN